jgi:hypothetical protein
VRKITIDADKKEIIISSCNLNSDGKEEETSKRTLSFNELEYMKIGEKIEPSLEYSENYKKETLEILNKNRFHATFKIITEEKHDKSMETSSKINTITFDENLKKQFKEEDISEGLKKCHGAKHMGMHHRHHGMHKHSHKKHVHPKYPCFHGYVAIHEQPSRNQRFPNHPKV